jgi:TRAP-type C4-dicarboxylate transport system permease small subunit
VSNPSDEDPKSTTGRVEAELEVPPTRRSVAKEEPPIRQSAIELMAEPTRFPDDGPLSHRLRMIDQYAGVAEQVLLFGMLATIIIIATVQALSTKLFGHSFLWSFDVVRAGTFVIAMTGAAFASRFASHLSMDVLSRFLGARRRLVLKVALGSVTIFAAGLLANAGLHIRAQVASEGGEHTVPPGLLAAMIPIGAGLIIFHTFLHMLIDIDYIVRGKLPPEKAPTGH